MRERERERERERTSLPFSFGENGMEVEDQIIITKIQ